MSNQEYLSNNPNLFLKPCAIGAEVGLTYFNFRQRRGFSPALRSIRLTAPLPNMVIDTLGNLLGSLCLILQSVEIMVVFF